MFSGFGWIADLVKNLSLISSPFVQGLCMVGAVVIVISICVAAVKIFAKTK